MFETKHLRNVLEKHEIWTFYIDDKGKKFEICILYRTYGQRLKKKPNTAGIVLFYWPWNDMINLHNCMEERIQTEVIQMNRN